MFKSEYKSYNTCPKIIGMDVVIHRREKSIKSETFRSCSFFAWFVALCRREPLQYALPPSSIDAPKLTIFDHQPTYQDSHQ